MTIKIALQNATERRRLNYKKKKMEFYADKTWRGTSFYQILRYEPNLFYSALCTNSPIKDSFPDSSASPFHGVQES